MNKGNRVAKAYWWRGDDRFKFGNFGDLLCKEILAKLCLFPIEYSEENGKLVSLGSVMHEVASNDTVWGTGVNGKTLQAKIPPNNNIFNVRGPLTLEWLKKNNIKVKSSLFFDPALLVSRLFPFTGEENVEIGIVPHYSNYHEIQKKVKSREILLINPDAHPMTVLKKIRKCSKIISSSLHGIVCAESYGIPAVYYKDDNSIEPDFKYADYYLGTSRDFQYCTSLKECFDNFQPKPDIPFEDIMGSFGIAVENAVRIQKR